MLLSQIWQLLQEPDKSRQELPAVRTEMQNTTSSCESMRRWENLKCTKIPLKRAKKAVKNSEMWLKSLCGYVTMKLS